MKVTSRCVVLLGGRTQKLLPLPLLEKSTKLPQMPLHGDFLKNLY